MTPTDTARIVGRLWHASQEDVTAHEADQLVAGIVTVLACVAVGIVVTLLLPNRTLEAAVLSAVTVGLLAWRGRWAWEKVKGWIG